MTNQQLYLAIGVPLLVNGIMFGLMMLYINHRLGDFQRYIDARFAAFESVWRSELNRVEGVIDARLKSLEESR